jgi:hypothetical protein
MPVTVCLVSLVSDQTLPNILPILHFHPDFLLFLSTPQMEDKGKTRAILESLKERGQDWDYASPERHLVLKVQPDSVRDLQRQASAWLDEEEARGRHWHFVVNLTGGTKIMSLAAYDLFSDYKPRMVYQFIETNELISPFPKRQPDPPEKIQARLTVPEFLLAYGLSMPNRHRWAAAKAAAKARRELTWWLFKNYRELTPFLADFHRKYGGLSFKKTRTIQEELHFTVGSEAAAELLRRLGWEGGIMSLTRDLWLYLRGGWLEEYAFLALEQVLPAGAALELGVEVVDPAGAKNEFDIMFTYANTLNIVECKSLEAGGTAERGSPTLEDFLYKLSALGQNFGLNPQLFLLSTSEKVLNNEGQLREKYQKRAGQLKIKIVPLSDQADIVDFFRRRFPPEGA